MYKIMDVAKILGVSKVTIYKKIKDHEFELRDNLFLVKGVKCVDEDGLQILKAILDGHQESLYHEENESVLKCDKCEKMKSEVEELKKFIIQQKVMYEKEMSRIYDILNNQVYVKTKELDQKTIIINGYKEIISYNKNRINSLEEKSYKASKFT